jgi:hypothetical protein
MKLTAQTTTMIGEMLGLLFMESSWPQHVIANINKNNDWCLNTLDLFVVLWYQVVFKDYLEMDEGSWKDERKKKEEKKERNVVIWSDCSFILSLSYISHTHTCVFI